MFIRSMIFCSFFMLCAITIKGQQKNALNSGSIKGIVRDTALNYVLKSATVAIYKADKQDSSLISYQITNTYGEFNLANLPVAYPLKLQINMVGYQSLNKHFTIPTDTKHINLNTLILNQKNISLKEVMITVPPISMNGDTLEFNAAAFKLDTNAVVEDLLRKIPNITLWGDGKITVNGRDVKSLLVNGKEFFAGDFKIATQNIAKNAIDKVQVYNTAKNRSNPLDSTMEMNVKLKKGKEIGYFGKIGAGYGTNKRYETDASINTFTPKMQFALIAATNNINKLANNVRTLSSNSTFKGVGTNIEYRPDFSASGITQPKALGATFTYNFVEKPTYDSKSRLSINYFMQDRNNDNSSNSETTTATNSTGKILDKNISKRGAHNTDQKFDSKYEWIKRNQALTINQAFTVNHTKSIDEVSTSSLNDKNVNTSTNNSVNQISGTNTIFDFAVNYQMGENFTKFLQKFKGFSASYTLGIDDENSARLNQTDFKSFTNPSSDRKFNRKYQIKSSNVNQHFNLEFNKLKELFFGNHKLAGIDFSISNSMGLNEKRNNNLIEDFNNSTSIYEQNTFLTNRLQTNTIEEVPAFILTKSISNNLSNRFLKNWVFRAAATQKIIYQNNQSDKSHQNIKRSYSRFAPEASINYNNHQYGEYNRNYSINYTTSIQIPTLQQLAPLIDSTNVYSIRNGNIHLTESLTRNISFSFNHEDQTTNNTLYYSAEINAGIIDNNMVDSTLISNDNRRTIFLINADGSKYLSINGSIRKALKLKTSELQMGLNNRIRTSKNPNYLNGTFTFSNDVNTNTNLTLNYTYKDYLAVEAVQSYSTYKSKQEAFKTQYSGANMASTLSSSYSVTKKLTINSNITFNRSTSVNNPAINFAIWNASVVQRLLKGNNLEFKFSALDLLRQNSSVINYSSSNSFTIGTQNVLQNYFMTTLSYYPRQFGKKATKR